jgi:predicted methyltransferase
MRISKSILAVAFAMPFMALATAADSPSAVPAYVTAAMSDPARKDDAKDDARRQGAAVVAFTGVKPGDKVVELIPGGGYWTRVFSAVVGAKGHVYTVWPHGMDQYMTKTMANWQELVKKAPYTNVSVLATANDALGVTEPVDVVFTSQNYHDYHDPFMGSVDMAKFNKLVFDALKPGGVYVVIDNVAPAGSGFADTDTTHRVDPEAVKKEVLAAGFVFDGSSDVLHNPADTHALKSYEPPMAGHNDQFIFRFKKPAK